jgi:hypothetical protein
MWTLPESIVPLYLVKVYDTQYFSHTCRETSLVVSYVGNMKAIELVHSDQSIIAETSGPGSPIPVFACGVAPHPLEKLCEFSLPTVVGPQTAPPCQGIQPCLHCS